LRWALGEARARRGRLRAIHAWMSPYDYQLEVYFRPDEAALRAAAQRRLDEALAEVNIGAVDVRGHGIEGARHERQHGPVAHDVVDPGRGELASGADELLGDVERDDFGALARQQPRVVPLTTAEIEGA
jgi:hypothetical protein